MWLQTMDPVKSDQPVYPQMQNSLLMDSVRLGNNQGIKNFSQAESESLNENLSEVWTDLSL